MMQAANKEVRSVPEERKVRGIKIDKDATVANRLKRGPWIQWMILVVLFATIIQQQSNTRSIISSNDEYIAALDRVERQLLNLEQIVASHSEEDAIFLKIAILKPRIDKELGRKIAKSVREHARLFKRDPNLILSMMRVESNFNPKAVSNMGALGLMQVMPQWKEQLGITGDMTDIDTNIKYGLQILAFYDNMYKDLEVALSAYNRGPGMIDYDLRNGNDPTRNGYARGVMKVYEDLKLLTAVDQ